MMDIYPGDILKPPKPAGDKVRFRVRERNMWRGDIQYTLQLYTSLGAGLGYGWHDKSFDHFLWAADLQARGFVVECREKRQLKLF